VQPPDDDIAVDDIGVVDITVDDIAVLDDEALAVEDIAVEDIAVEDSADQRRALRRPPVDPRIRARRIAVAREQGRRRLRIVVVLMTLFVVAGTAWLLVQSPILDVDHIVVVGVPQERVAAVIAASGIHRHDPLLLVSTSAVAHRIEHLPGIASVHVSRELPGTVRITAHEQVVALWVRATGNKVALVGYDGRVVGYAAAPPAGVIELRGLRPVPSPGSRIPDPGVVDVEAQLPLSLGGRVGAISARSSTDVRLYLVQGGEVRIGDLSLVHDKGVAALAVINRMGCVLNYVDVRSIANPVALPAPGATCNQ
jgi:POTRA domain, FtsQ-type